MPPIFEPSQPNLTGVRPPTAPLRVLVLAPAEGGRWDGWLDALAGATTRLELSPVPGGHSPAALARAARRLQPDVALVLGERVPARAVGVLRALGWPVVTVGRTAGETHLRTSTLLRAAEISAADAEVLVREDPQSIAGMLAAVAGRPGAGIEHGPPMSVVSTVFNEADAVDDLVEAVRAQMRDDDELIVVDGGSRDDTLDRLRAWARRDPRVRAISEPGADISEGRNAGVAAARNAAVACTDANCTPSPGWLDAMRVAFAERTVPGLVTGTCRVLGGSPLQSAQSLACYYDPDEARRPSLPVRLYGRLFGNVLDPTYPAGRSIGFTVDAWREVGGFPVGFLGTEDATFGGAIARLHPCVVAADAEVSWEQAPRWRATARMYFHYGQGPPYAGNAKLQLRDAARAVAYAAAPPLAVAGGARTRAAIAAGALVYLSLPLVRARRARAGIDVILALPVATVTKDLSKVAGAAVGQMQRRRGERPASKVERGFDPAAV